MRSPGLLLACMLTGVVSCSEDGPEPVSLPCDVREEACQEAVFRATASARGQPDASLPRVRIISREQLEEEVRMDSAERAGELDESTKLEEQQDQAILALLNLVPGDERVFEEAQIEQIVGYAAYYSPLDDDITVVADNITSDRSGTYILSHEYVHALQDQREDIIGLHEAFADTTDEHVALNALIEGEATWLSDLMDGPIPHRAGVYQRSLMAALRSIEAAVAPLRRALVVLPYPVGASYLVLRSQRDAALAIEELYADPPLALRSWIERDAFVSPLRLNVLSRTLPVVLDCGPPPAPDGYELVLEDSLGFTGLLAYRVAHGQPGEDAFLPAGHWCGDHLAGYASITDPTSVALAWRISVCSPVLADILLGVIRRSTSNMVVQHDEEVLITAATDAALIADWPPADDCAAPDKARPHSRWPAARAANVLSTGGWGQAYVP
jgi:hypothetical protein